MSVARVLGRTLKRISQRMTAVVFVAKGLIHLVRQGRLVWLIYVVENRLQYRLNALHAGVLANRSGAACQFNFRRNIHRLEKGLSHKQQKGTFAEDFILDTVDYLACIKGSCGADVDTIAWGEAVLDLYFKTCQRTKCIAEAEAQFRSLEPDISHPEWFSYLERDRPEAAVAHEALYQLALRRRSVRHFLDKEVGFSLIQKAMRIAALSPSACNRQPYKFLFFNDESVTRSITEIPGGVGGYKFPSVIVVTASYRAYFDERDAHVPIIDATLAAMSFMFALETLGLSSLCINWPSLPDRDRRLRKLIRLEEDEFVVMLIGVGYADPDGKIPYSAKRHVSELALLNERIRI